MSSEPPNCSFQVLENIQTSTLPFYMLLQFLHIFLCLLAVIFIKFSHKMLERVFISHNLKVLLSFQRFFMNLYCASFVIVGTYHFVDRFISVGCDLLVSAKWCVIFRIFQSWASVFFQLFYIGVALDNIASLFSIWYRNLESHGPKSIGYAMALFALFTTAPSVPIDWNSTSKLINCASLENKSNTIQRRVFVWFIFLDILSLASFGFLKMFQKFEMSNPVLKYSVHKRVAVKELVRTVQIIVPNLIFNVFCYLYFASVSILNTTGENVDPIRFLMANSVPFYICLSPLIWIFAIRRLDAKLDVRKNVNTFENHFNSLNDFWNGELEKGEEPPGPRIQRKMSHPERLFDNISSCNSVHPAPGSVV